MSQPDLPKAHVGERLESWKEIAAYLKREVRTVRRWEKSEGLPVHRHVHNKLATVYAYVAELDAWREQRETQVRPEPARDWRLPWMAAAALALAALALFAFWQLGSRATPSVEKDRPIAGRLLAATTGENQQLRTLPVGSVIVRLALARDGGRLYAADTAGALHIIDSSTLRVIRTIGVKGSPFELEPSPDGKWLYVGTEQGDVLRFDTATEEMRPIARGLEQLRDFALTNDGAKLYIAANFKGLHVLDLESRALRQIPTVGCPSFVTNVPGKDLLYVAYQCGGPGGRSGHDAIDMRVASTGEALATISGPPNVSYQVSSSPDGSQIWVEGGDACYGSQYDHVGCPQVPGGVINIFRVDDNRHLASLATDAAWGFSFFPDSSRVLGGGENLKVIDVASMRVLEVASFRLGGSAAFAPDGSRVYLPGGISGEVAVLELGSAECLPPPTQLMTWLSGDGDVTDVRDGNSGELRNGARIVPAWVGQGFEFDGVDDYLHIPNLSNIDTGKDFTVAFWLKPKSQAAAVIMDHAPLGMSGMQVAVLGSGAVTFCHHSYGADCFSAPERSLSGRMALHPEEWAHVAVSISRGSMSLYVNGKLAAAKEVSPWPLLRARHDFRIGGPFGKGRFFAGKLDEIQMFTRVLTADEISRLHAAGRWGLCYQ